ncbi:MAG TPA: diaminopimelate decarboxylase [Candidatus Kapabacteria bacterium]|nr:diaminopimelate decarboxylase [Candidatus Kapabacteria bacterium]
MEFPFYYEDGELYGESLAISTLAEEFGTPLFVYSKRHISDTIATIKTTAKESNGNWNISYAVKANSNSEILKLIASEGLGASVVSGGELVAALKAGFPASKITFDGPGKTKEEILLALRSKIKAIVVESEQELELISREAAQLGVVAQVLIRVNPHIDAKTHPYISTGLLENKFGIDIVEAEALIDRFSSNSVSIIGLHTHIGSQISELLPFEETAASLADVIKRNHSSGKKTLTHINVGGGRAIAYHDRVKHPKLASDPDPKEDLIPSYTEYFNKLTAIFQNTGVELTVEPGRSIIGESCLLLSKVLYTKANSKRSFVIGDAAMNDLLRPSLYRAYHQIVPVSINVARALQTTSVVGPICETGDFLAHDRMLPAFEPNEYFAVLCAGAYGYALSSNYNLRPRAAEVLIDGDFATVIRKRETIEEIL